MSTALWANRLLDGVVTSDQSDKVAMHRHLKKLDKLCAISGIRSISSFCDSTDAQCNLEVVELPEDMNSTDELMASQGIWIDAEEASSILKSLINDIRENQIRFGMVRNDHHQILEELQESYEFAKASAASNGELNFSVVM